MFFDEDYDDEKREEMEERSWLKVMGAALLLSLVFLIACAAATEQPFRQAYQDCIERGGNTLTCSQE
ncbi:hypothetical protein [Kushneria konosiri]|uniref:Uncharacterized protein n=1 Tax=Kushneria konosiri TaxID=698828 RepID=A0A2Z2H8D8_9GAMM|nr:hypothetical protein [Kushneria konosiri]ARS51530.1 hypothetical protein B9G99_00285 [Kushneria konosiri]